MSKPTEYTVLEIADLDGNIQFWMYDVTEKKGRRLGYTTLVSALSTAIGGTPTTIAVTNQLISGDGAGNGVASGYTIAQIVSSIAAKANSSHTHAISDVTSLQTALDGKASTTHTHAISDVTNLQSTLNGKASSSHTHAISDVTGLQTALDGKAAASHTHTPSQIQDWGSESPSGLSAVDASSTQINLSWSHNAGTGFDVRYVIERATSSSGPWEVIATTSANATSYSSTGLSPGVQYFYRIKGRFGPFYSGYITANATTPTGEPAETGWKNASTCTDAGSWSDPENAFSEDGSYATVSDPNTTQIHLQGYDFSIPAGADIEGIMVRVKVGATGSTVFEHDFQLEKTGESTIGSNFADGGDSLSAVGWRSYGSPTTMPDGTQNFPSVSDINSSNFGARWNGLNPDSETISIDALQIRVFYRA